MANIKISELTEIAEIPANTQNLLLVGVDTTPLVPVTHKVRFSTLYDYIDNLGLQAYDQANTANTNAVTSGVYANSAFNQANTVYLPSVTRLNTTNSGTSSYMFDQYTGNNPDIFIRAGETLAFNLNVTGHPFLIRETAGGTLYNIGLTHVSTTGIVTTDSSAQAQVSGTLYWKVPAELAGNNYVYQCQVHSGMVGNVIIEIPNQANSAINLAQVAFNQANAASQTIPQNAQTENYTLQLTDAGKHIYYTQASDTTLYIPTTSDVAFSNGSTIMIVSRTSSSANVTVSPNTGVAMYLAGNTTSVSRNVTTYGMATLIQVEANTWFINGTGVS